MTTLKELSDAAPQGEWAVCGDGTYVKPLPLDQFFRPIVSTAPLIKWGDGNWLEADYQQPKDSALFIATLVNAFRNGDLVEKPKAVEGELLPCPFCGGSDIHHASSDEPFLYCEQCAHRASEFGSKEQAIEAWNTRAHAAPAVKVKSLVWEIVSRHPHRYKSACGNYKVYDSGHDGMAWGFRSDSPCGFTYEYHFDVGTYAFDAAQSHHEAAVLSAIEPTQDSTNAPAPVDTTQPKG